MILAKKLNVLHFVTSGLFKSTYLHTRPKVSNFYITPNIYVCIMCDGNDYNKTTNNHIDNLKAKMM